MISVFYSTYQNHKEQSRAGRALLGFVLREYYGISPECAEIARGEQGKPYFTNVPLCFSISHSGGVVVVAVSEKEIGVDIEPIREIGRHIGVRYLGIDTDDKKTLVREWVRRESYGKLTGEGFFYKEKTEPLFQKEYQLEHDYTKYYVCISTREDTFPKSCIFVSPEKMQ